MLMPVLLGFPKEKEPFGEDGPPDDLLPPVDRLLELGFHRPPVPLRELEPAERSEEAGPVPLLLLLLANRLELAVGRREC